MAELSDSLRDAVFYGILDTGYVAESDMANKCRMLVESGAKLIQLRVKNETVERLREMAFEILPFFRKKGAPYFIINDSPQVAAEICSIIPNAGLHIGQDDIPPRQAREIIGKRRVLGLSTHSEEQAKSAEELRDVIDYFAVGPVYATNTKPGRPAVGLGLVRAVAQSNPTLPWFAIGGINLKTAGEVRRAGAKRIVAVSDVLVPPDTRGAVIKLVDKFLSKDR